jgi:hypothetical protein
MELVKESRPKHTDKKGLDLLLQKCCSSKVIFLTARTYEMMSETESHFEELGLPNKLMIYYDAEDKGLRLKEIIELRNEVRKSKPHMKDLKIIFVDDLHTNLTSVSQALGDMVKCFKFKLKNPEP